MRMPQWFSAVVVGATALVLDAFVRGLASEYDLAIGPAAVGLIAAGGALAKAIGGRSRPGYRPSKSTLRRYEGLQRQDIEKLYTPEAFEGPGLGFSPLEMGAGIGQAGSASESEYQADIGALERAVSSGGLRVQSGAYHRGRQRARGGDLARNAEIRRANVLANALQKRRDIYARLGMTSDAYGQGTGLYNAAQAGRVKSRGLSAVGDFMQGFAGSYGLGGAGAAAQYRDPFTVSGPM